MTNLVVAESGGTYRSFPLDEKKAAALVERDVLYPCGEEHGDDLHLNPERSWTVGAVEAVLLATLP